MVVDQGLMILQCQRDARLAGIAGTLDQRLAAPSPDLFFGELFVDDRPETFGNVIGGQLRMSRDSPPC